MGARFPIPHGSPFLKSSIVLFTLLVVFCTNFELVSSSPAIASFFDKCGGRSKNNEHAGHETGPVTPMPDEEEQAEQEEKLFHAAPPPPPPTEKPLTPEEIADRNDVANWVLDPSPCKERVFYTRFKFNEGPEVLPFTFDNFGGNLTTIPHTTGIFSKQQLESNFTVKDEHLPYDLFKKPEFQDAVLKSKTGLQKFFYWEPTAAVNLGEPAPVTDIKSMSVAIQPKAGVLFYQRQAHCMLKPKKEGKGLTTQYFMIWSSIMHSPMPAFDACTSEFGIIPHKLSITGNEMFAIWNNGTVPMDFDLTKAHFTAGLTWTGSPSLKKGVKVETGSAGEYDISESPLFKRMAAAGESTAGLPAFVFPKSYRQIALDKKTEIEPGTFIKPYQQVAHCGDYHVVGRSVFVRHYKGDGVTCFEPEVDQGANAGTVGQCSICPDLVNCVQQETCRTKCEKPHTMLPHHEYYMYGTKEEAVKAGA